MAIIDEYIPGFVNNPELGPVAGMKMRVLLKFPQVELTKEQVAEIIERLDALDA